MDFTTGSHAWHRMEGDQVGRRLPGGPPRAPAHTGPTQDPLPSHPEVPPLCVQADTCSREWVSLGHSVAERPSEPYGFSLTLLTSNLWGMVHGAGKGPLHSTALAGCCLWLSACPLPGTPWPALVPFTWTLHGHLLHPASPPYTSKKSPSTVRPLRAFQTRRRQSQTSRPTGCHPDVQLHLACQPGSRGLGSRT